VSSNFAVVYDANIFFGAFRRTVMLHLAQAGIFRAKWTEDIHKEWMSNLKERYPDIPIEKIQTLLDGRRLETSGIAVMKRAGSSGSQRKRQTVRRRSRSRKNSRAR
jgi:hypothetical protein